MISICERVDKLIKGNKPLQIHIGNQWIDFDGETYELLKFHRADIREKPEKEFILGDWWIPWTNAKPEKLTLENIMYYNGTKPYAQNTEVELWHPKVGEWCWFWNQSDINLSISPHIGQYGNLSYSLEFYDNCEPFIGQLPTFIKDQS